MSDLNRPGVKDDGGKNRMGLVINYFPRALKEVGKVATFGARKYTPYGWLSVPNGIERYTDAMHRHLLDEAIGEKLDAESDILHAALREHKQALADVMALPDRESRRRFLADYRTKWGALNAEGLEMRVRQAWLYRSPYA
jgi:hypothetical protein